MGAIIVTVTGPSGSGKTELVDELCRNHNFAKLVSVTTRPPRPGEIEGQDYYFISEEKFDLLKKTDSLIQSTEFNGFKYATTLEELERVSDQGKTPIVIVEPTGVPQFQEIADRYGYELHTVFIEAQREILIERYLRRILGETDAGRLPYHAKRIAAISDELGWGDSWDFDTRIQNNLNDLTEIAKFANLIGKLYGQSRNAA